MISFKASYINTTNVKECSLKRKNYKNLKTSFVELHTNSKSDLKTLNSLADYWGEDDTYAGDIRDEFLGKKYSRQKEHKRFFAITSQQRSYKKLDPYKMLGIANITEKDEKTFFINYLQVNPLYIYPLKDRKIKHIGKVLIESIKSVDGAKDIILQAVSGSQKFYKKMGFKPFKEYLMILKQNKAVK